MVVKLKGTCPKCLVENTVKLTDPKKPVPFSVDWKCGNCSAPMALLRGKVRPAA